MSPTVRHLLLSAVAVVAACGSDGTAPQRPPAVYPVSATLGAGASRLFVLRGADGATKPGAVWTTSDSTIATVDDEGVVRSGGTGRATIRATLAGRSYEADLSAEPLRFASISPGMMHTCGLSLRGEALCWGENSLGQLGDGTTDARLAPSQTFTDLTFTTLEAGQGGQTCGLVADGSAYCWGEDFPTRAGTENTVRTPTLLPGGLKFASLSVGFLFACGISTTGDAWCWGSNRYGQLGATTQSDCGMPCSPTPVRVGGGYRFKAISAGGFHTCALTVDGAAYCWGLDQFGEMGNGSSELQTAHPDPVPVVGGHVFVAITSATDHSCALTADGSAWCWGENYSGGLGAASTDSCGMNGAWPCSTTPVQVQGGHRFSEIRAGNAAIFPGSLGCGLEQETVYCWGSNWRGALGIGQSIAGTAVPTAVAGNHAFDSLAVGDLACGITPDHRALCWGRNEFGQIGDGDTTDAAVPTPVGMPSATTVAARVAMPRDAPAFSFGFVTPFRETIRRPAPPARLRRAH